MPLDKHIGPTGESGTLFAKRRAKGRADFAHSSCLALGLAMTPSACALLAKYNRWMNLRLYDATGRLSEAQIFEDRSAFFESSMTAFIPSEA